MFPFGGNPLSFTALSNRLFLNCVSSTEQWKEGAIPVYCSFFITSYNAPQIHLVGVKAGHVGAWLKREQRFEMLKKSQQTAFKDKIKNKKWKGSCEIHVILVGGLFICSLFVFPCPLGPPGGGFAPGCSSAAQVVFTVGSPPSGSTPPLTSRQRKCSGSAQKSPQNKCPTLFLFFYCLEGSFFIECWTKKNKMQEKKKNLPCLSL